MMFGCLVSIATVKEIDQTTKEETGKDLTFWVNKKVRPTTS